MARVAAALLMTINVEAACDLHSAEDLVARYGEVFSTGNRNAASHLWTSYILEHASGCDAETVEALFRGFCPVSGSPLPDDPRTQYQVLLRKVGGGEVEGIAHICCWPCICDMRDSVWVDTMTFATSDGVQRRNALVVGDPCGASDAAAALGASFVDPFSAQSTDLGMEAPEIRCEDGKLGGATFSEHGYPIIGMLFDLDSVVAGTEPQQYTGYSDQCVARQEQGYNSGMGLIFHKVVAINPISLVQLPQQASDLAAPDSSRASAAGRVVPALALLAAVVLTLRSRWTSAAHNDTEEVTPFDAVE